jgi:tripartite-type tricarboxylate transporter receptor subunit TctC
MTPLHLPAARRLARWTAGFCIATTACGAALAQGAWPSKPIHMIVPYSAGGSTDQLARALQPSMQSTLGQPIVIDNKPGAGGAIGVEQGARSAADGYTLIFGNTGPSATVSLMRKVPYDPLTDFTPISTVCFAPLALVVTNDVPARNFAEFLAWTRKAGASANYGSVGIGSLSHLTGEYFNDFAGTKMQHIPYSGGSALLTAMLSGQPKIAWVNPLDGTSMIATGKVRYIGIATPQRFDPLPDVETIASTLPGFKSMAWFGVLAPKGLPPEIAAKVHAAVVKAVASPEVKKVLAERNVIARSSTPQELTQIIKDEQALWGPVIQKSDIKL